MNKLMIVLFFLMGGFYVKGQIPFWNLPPNSITEGQPLQPLPTPSPYPLQSGPQYEDLYYAGASSDYTHNAMIDANGGPLFFINDGFLYDHEGYAFAQLHINAGQITEDVRGNSEVCLVPDPANCLRYYIFTNVSDGQFPLGVYTHLDVSLPSNVFLPEYGPKYGKLLFGNPNDWNYDNCEPIADIGLPGFVPTDNQNMFFAASQLNQNNERFVFVQRRAQIWKLIIDDLGVTASSNIIDLSNIFSSLTPGSFGSERQELELIALANGNYRLGLTYPGLGDQNAHVVAILELNQNGDYIPGSGFATTLSVEDGDRPIVKGLEFSTDGNILYFTHHEVDAAQMAIQYIDYPNQSVHNLDVPNRQNYQYSQIEIGTDGAMYFA